VEQVYVAPGNAGTAIENNIENVDIGAENIDALLKFALSNNIDLTIVGPEAPLVAGIVDQFESHKLTIFGPTANAAQLEGSKTFTKDFLDRHQIPTAAYQSFTEMTAACEYVKQQGTPIVIKADGLAAGKGVIIAQSQSEAEATITDMLEGNRFGEAGHRVLIEAFLDGEEASFICIVDGEKVLPLATSQDHKARDNEDLGPNTGGMGAYSPAPVVTPPVYKRIMDDVILPTIRGMADEGNTYTGFLYAGLMITADGTPKVIEYNCRFGDPETQAIMMRLQSDLVALCMAALDGGLADIETRWDERSAVGVVMAAGGYPGNYNKGDEIFGLPAETGGTTKVFHGGTVLRDGAVLTRGGRVLCVTSLGETVSSAQQEAYRAAANINWSGAFYRTDIAYRAIAREQDAGNC